MSASPSSVISGTVGQNVSVSVTVMGSDGQPYAGGAVSFSVTSGGGTVSPTSAVTSASGTASATWTLGETAGTQSLTASIGTASASFQANAAAGSAAAIQAITSFPGQYEPDTELPQDAVFEVEDQFGNKVSGASVTFSASSGGEVDPAQASSDSQGRASTTWTLGPGNGTQTLTASVGSSTQASVQAEAYDPCQDYQTISMGGTVSGTLSSESCEAEVEHVLRFLDWYLFTLDTPRALHFQASAAFSSPSLRIYDNTGFAGAFIDRNDNVVDLRGFLDVSPLTTSGRAAATSSESYLLGILSDAGGVGAYQILANIHSGQMEECANWITTGVLSTNQTLEGTECTIHVTRQDGTEFDRNADRIFVYLQAGEGLALGETSNTIDPLLYVFDNSGNLIAWNDDIDTTGGNFNSYLEFTAEETGYYRIYASIFDPADQAAGVGPYTLQINPLAVTSPEGAPQSVVRMRRGQERTLDFGSVGRGEHAAERGNQGKGRSR